MRCRFGHGAPFFAARVEREEWGALWDSCIYEEVVGDGLLEGEVVVKFRLVKKYCRSAGQK